jgi:NAD+ kinase
VNEQVVFDPQNSHRRKSSLVTADTAAQRFQTRKNTECYVHALLESRREQGAPFHGGLNGIAETLVGRRIDSGGGGLDGPVEPKAASDAEDDPTVGQEDEKAWRERRASLASDSGKMEVQQGEEPNAVHSRLLTKKQLSDMAWGVRELSKRLGSIKLKLKVRTVFLLTKAHDETLIGNTRDVARWLLNPERTFRYTVFVEENLRENKKFNAEELLRELEELEKEKGETNDEEGKGDRRLRYWNDEMCKKRPQTFDFVITLGGDGTVLYASWLFQRIVPPVLSFALGSLGFLTKFDYEEYQEILTRAFRDGVTISLRLRFEGTVMRSQSRKKGPIQNRETTDSDAGNEEEEDESKRDLVEELAGEEKGDERTHRPDGTYEILNDIVIDRGPNPSRFAFYPYLGQF